MVRRDFSDTTVKHHHWWKEHHRVDKTVIWHCMDEDCSVTRTTRVEPLPWMD